MTKIVEFPKSKIFREVPPNIEEIEKAREKGIIKHAESIVEDFQINMLEAMENYGIDIDSDFFLKDMSIVTDFIRAAIFRSFKIEHPLHNFVDNNVTLIKRSEVFKDLEDDDEEEIDPVA